MSNPELLKKYGSNTEKILTELAKEIGEELATKCYFKSKCFSTQ